MTGPLHVTHVVLSLDVGGLERNVVNQARVAGSVGQRVSIVCVERPGELAGKAEGAGARVISLGKTRGLHPGIVGRMRAALRTLSPDVVHTHQIGPLFYASVAAVGLRLPLLVHTEHGLKIDIDRRVRWLGRVGAQRAARFYCLSQQMADRVVAGRVANRRKVRVIQNGIDTTEFREAGDSAATRAGLGIPPGVPVVGSVGRLAEVKRFDVLLRGFARVRATLPDAHLVLVGDGPRREALAALAAELRIDPWVRFAGYQSSAAPFLHAMDVFALTSESEGMPQSVLEACVAGVPVVASAVGGIPEVVSPGETGLLVPPGDETAVAVGLIRLLTDRPAAARFAAAARARVEGRFSIRRMAAEYDHQFRELLAARRSQRAAAGRGRRRGGDRSPSAGRDHADAPAGAGVR